MSATCDACPGEGEELCLEGVCEARGDDAVSVSAEILRIEPRQLEVPSVVHILASMSGPSGAFDCAQAEADQGVGLNVLREGFKNLSGGSQHTDMSFGRVPEGQVALLLLGVDAGSGDGQVIATGCVADIEAAGDDVALELVTLNGL